MIKTREESASGIS